MPPTPDVNVVNGCACPRHPLHEPPTLTMNAPLALHSRRDPGKVHTPLNSVWILAHPSYRSTEKP